MAKPLPIPFTQSEIRELFSYSPWTGECYRFDKKSHKNETIQRHLAGNGYLFAVVGQRHYYIHRLAFLWMTGEVPDVIDHIDGNPWNNCWRNLRPSTFSQNQGNQKKPKNNTSGLKGVRQVTKNRYMARLGGKYLGLFDSPQSARQAYCDAAKEHWGEYSKPT